jgi:hypothetical protein
LPASAKKSKSASPRATSVADTFANELVGPKAVFFPDLGAGDGNRTRDIQLGKLTYVIDFADARSSSRRQRIETVGKTRSYPIPEFAAWSDRVRLAFLGHSALKVSNSYSSKGIIWLVTGWSSPPCPHSLSADTAP